eukprot:TRINITY_DN11241_c0_g1_i2.p1 TRINITY_DN11241_c0_g1~~TRINITY_DN11241_c0_g1_i2.p1  ORF type:complete len:420 (-),score=124.14 TRINITY_DN11241_c0_g1_i2:93-1352(-)
MMVGGEVLLMVVGEFVSVEEEVGELEGGPVEELVVELEEEQPQQQPQLQLRQQQQRQQESREPQHSSQQVHSSTHCDQPRMFGVLCTINSGTSTTSTTSTNSTTLYSSCFGVTASVLGCVVFGITSFGILTVGKQIFRILTTEKRGDMLWAKIIIEDTGPSRISYHYSPSIGKKFLCTGTGGGGGGGRLFLHPSHWPSWVWKKYDPNILLLKLKESSKGILDIRKIPEDPFDASFWVARNLIMSTKLRQELLEKPTNLRILWLMKLLEFYSIFSCASCGQEIGHVKDIFSINPDGGRGGGDGGNRRRGGGGRNPQDSYVNGYGVVYDTVTLRRLSTRPILMSSNPTTKDTWFPGYGWIIAVCPNCLHHLGWLFVSVRPTCDDEDDEDDDESDRPTVFWGLSRVNIHIPRSVPPGVSDFY